MPQRLTKSDFLLYLKCRKSFWIFKKKPNQYPDGEFSMMAQKLTQEGYEVEEYVKQHLKQSRPSSKLYFQSSFEDTVGLYARADVLEEDGNGKVTLYEVKSSTTIKRDKAHNHIKDACFQKICLRRAGKQVDKIVLAHPNGDYRRDSKIDTKKFLHFQDVTAEVIEIEHLVEQEIDAALSLLREKDIDLDSCSCRHETRRNHCDTFDLFNPNIPKPSIYSLPRVRSDKIATLASGGIFKLDEIPETLALSEQQKTVITAYKNQQPQASIERISSRLDEYRYPLYFLDYETYASSVPIIDGTGPHQTIPVQYSLHILHANGRLQHREFLLRSFTLPKQLLTQLKKDIGAEGSIVSWHASFERMQNKNLADWFSGEKDFLMNINDRMVDLEDFFKLDYVDARFDGSTSIKKVLPIVCPGLSYNKLDVQNGTEAMETWARMVRSETKYAQALANALLNYCKLDTLAMVEIFRFLKKLID